MGTVPISAPSITRQQQGLDTMTLLLELEADVNAVDLEGNTPLMLLRLPLQLCDDFSYLLLY